MKAVLHLPQWCVDVVANPPRSGEGFHNWLFRAARTLWKCGRTANDIRAVLENAAETCGRHVSSREIEDALKNSLTSAFQPSRQQPWPRVNKEQREAVIASGMGLVDLWEISPIRLEDNESHTEEIIDRLFPGNVLLCCGRLNTDFDTKPRENWRGELSTLQFIVPSAMSAITGRTKDGRESKHTLNNTGPRRCLVCEFDSGDVDDHAALLIHLAGYAPLVCALHSGNKSLHGWFNVANQPEEKVLKFFRYAVSLGADPQMWAPLQFCRMPDGLRNKGARQRVFFLNFKSLEAAR